jgi:hypothetical protein
MIYNYISCKTVISKVASDLNWQEEPHRIIDCIEWIGEGLKKIGAFPQMVTKTMGKEGLPLLQLVDHQAKLPFDLHSINQVAYAKAIGGPFYDMRYNTGSYGANHDMTNSHDLLTMEDNNDLQPSSEDGTTFTGNYYYTITGGYIKSNTKSGFLLISYQAIPVDNDGFPLVPNDESFLEALYWYINMKLLYPEWKRGSIRDAVYYDAKSSWNYYRKQAYGNAMMPDEAQLESIKNTWIRLIPQINANKSFFSTIGQQEYTFNSDRR